MSNRAKPGSGFSIAVGTGVLFTMLIVLILNVIYNTDTTWKFIVAGLLVLFMISAADRIKKEIKMRDSLTDMR